jgi:RND superfamily putative drug exporter
MILVPATMELLGNANWWFPKWLDRIVPNIHIEAGDDEVAGESELAGLLRQDELVRG